MVDMTDGKFFNINIDVTNSGGSVRGDMLISGHIRDMNELAEAHITALRAVIASAKLISEKHELAEQHRDKFREAFNRFCCDMITEQEARLHA